MKKEVFDQAVNPTYSMNEPIPGREAEMKENYAGGVGFDEGSEGLVRRFVILGIDNGNYYRNEHEMSSAVVEAIADMAKNNPDRLLDIIEDGRRTAMRPRNAIAAYAVGLANMSTAASWMKAADRYWGHQRFEYIIWTGSDLLYFMNYTRMLGRGIGKGLRKAISRWYAKKSDDWLEYQLVKYRNRQGFHQRDVIRLAHPKPKNDFAAQLFANMLGKDVEPTPRLAAIESIRQAESVSDVIRIVDEAGLTWEMIPTDPWHKKPEFWTMMVDRLPWNAFLRHLHRYLAMSPGSPGRRFALGRIRKMNVGKLHVHPGRVFDAYLALLSRNSLDYDFSDALKGAFFRGFESGKEIYEQADGHSILETPVAAPALRLGIAVDTSGSMFFGGNLINKALATAEILRRAADEASVVFFTTEPYVPKTRLSMGELAFVGEDDLEHGYGLQSGGTSVGSAIGHFTKSGEKLDAIVVITDEQSWAGAQVVSAFNEYRRKVNKNAKLVVVSLATGGVSLTDPADPSQITVIGWVPEIAEIVTRFVGG